MRLEGRITLGRSVSLYVAAAAAMVCSVAISPPWATAQSATPPHTSATPPHPNALSPQAVVGKYCLVCHSQQLHTAGVVLQGVDFSHPGSNAPLIERVLRKVRTGEMPPKGMPHPDTATREAFTNCLADALDTEAAAHPNPGRPAIHRLNRAEYSNAVRDLLAVDIKPGELLPVDDSGYGFDNIADVLSVSPALLERYMSTARIVSRLAVGDTGIKPAEEEFQPAEARRAGGSRQQTNERASDDLPFDSAGGMSFSYYFPLDGEYVIRVKAGPNGANEHKYEVRQSVKAGLRTIGVAFLRESAKAEVEAPVGRGPGAAFAGRGGRGGPPPAPAIMDLRLDDARIQRFEVPRGGPTPLPPFNGVVVSGPYNPTGAGDTASREKIFICHPKPGSENACAEKILTALARRAFRRTVTSDDVRPLMSFYEDGFKQSGFDYGIEKAIRAMLVSPDFVFRIEHDPRGIAPGGVYRISDFELASRLSFFMWSSIPDDRLLNLADEHKLHDPEVLHTEVVRMLADPKAEALVDNFAGQWLYLRNLEVAKPDPEIFPEFNDALRESFLQETNLFFQSILREDRPVTDLLTARYTYLNERLAEHYGIPGIYGSQFRRVALTTPERGGLLGQGAILTVTSYPNRTSVVQRGKWILETLLGSPPPPPPPDIPELKPENSEGKKLTAREQMEQHRANPTCASCHVRMDPLGFAMENYDGVGRWRTKDDGGLINAEGVLPDGTKFVGPAGLREAIVQTHSDEFISTFIQKLLTYALGRGVEYYDMPAVRQISRQAERDNYRISAVITAIVNSTPFQMRGARKP